MKQLHLNFWNMEKDTITFFGKNESVWSHLTVLKTNVEKLKANEALIGLADKTQKDKDPSGHTSQKDVQFEKMIQLGYKLSCKVASYALEENNRVLLNAVDYTLSQLEQGAENEVVARCLVIADKASDNLAQLAEYNVTEGEITTFSENIEKFKRMPAERDVITNERKGAVKSIPELVAEARQLFEKLDNNVDGLIDDPAFVNAYHQIRGINSRRGGRNSGKSNPAAEK